MNPQQTETTAGLRHLALFYRSAAEYLAATADFLTAGVETGERVLAAVPADKHAALRRRLGGYHDRVEFVDLFSLGRDPASIVPALVSFVGGGARRVRVLGEPIWPGLTQAEICAATRNEALVNAALGNAEVTILCPYDSTALPIKVIADACRTHPVLRSHGRELASVAYTGPGFRPAGCSPGQPASQEPVRRPPT